MTDIKESNGNETFQSNQALISATAITDFDCNSLHILNPVVWNTVLPLSKEASGLV